MPAATRMMVNIIRQLVYTPEALICEMYSFLSDCGNKFAMLQLCISMKVETENT